VAPAAGQGTGDQQQPVPMQTSPAPPPSSPQQQSGQQQHTQHTTGQPTGAYMPPNQPVPPPGAPAYMPWPQMGPGAEPHQLPNLPACPTAPWPYMVPPAQLYGVPNYPPTHPAAHHQGPIPGCYAPAVPMVFMTPWGWPAVAAPVSGWGGMPGPFSCAAAAPPPLPPGWQLGQAGGQLPPAVQGSRGPPAPTAAGSGRGNQRRKQVSKKARQVIEDATDRGDEDQEAGCTSDDDWLPEASVPAAAAAARSQQVVKVVYKASGCCDLLMPRCFLSCLPAQKAQAVSKNVNALKNRRPCQKM
jgi:hypothetical protein